MKKHVQKGFTLYELLITLTIVGVVLTIGIPNLSDFTRNGRISGTTNDLHGSFYLARSEAARAKESVTICASKNPMDAGAVCDGTFAEGWIIFIDRDADGGRDVGPDETLIKTFPPIDDAIEIKTNASNSFSFGPTGLGSEGSSFIAMICDDRGNTVSAGGNSAARRIVVTPIGRSTIIRSQQNIANSIAAATSPDDVSCTA